ncbi:MAG: 4Fe-4S ferredoxin [Treponema sp.]|nr:4Fe-4S ferredoxin [Treponema sp.]
MPAYRNIDLCDKSCMCLYVCPTGATDTENSIIDVDKCISGCMVCVHACPMGAISMIPLEYPPQQPKEEAVIQAQRFLAYSKLIQEGIAEECAQKAASPVVRQFAEALSLSNRKMAEDLIRESGYLLPQSFNVRKLLLAMSKEAEPGFPREAAELLLHKLAFV